MAEKKIIAVTGATGAQGGGLVRAILADRNGEFAARALTRNVNSEKAQELKKLGAEMVKADIDNEDKPDPGVQGGLWGVSASLFSGCTSPRKKSWPRPATWPAPPR